MTRILAAAAVSAIALAAAAAPGARAADITPQTISIVKVDVIGLTTAMRASGMIGADVYNGANEKVASIDDLLIQTKGDDRVIFAVLNVGGFLGMGERHIVVPYEDLKLNADQDGKRRLTLPDATREALKALPEFRYDKS